MRIRDGRAAVIGPRARESDYPEHTEVSASGAFGLSQCGLMPNAVICGVRHFLCPGHEETLHIDRAARGCGDYCDSRGDAAAGAEPGETHQPAGVVHVQPATDRDWRAAVCRYVRRLLLSVLHRHCQRPPVVVRFRARWPGSRLQPADRQGAGTADALRQFVRRPAAVSAFPVWRIDVL